MIIPKDLRERTEAAILRITTGQAPMRVPVDPSDPDVVLAEWLRVATPMPTADADPEVLATVTLGGYFSSEELGDIDIEPVMSALEQIQQDVVRSDEDAHLELVDRAHVTRLQAEVSALQQRLTIADQRVDDLQTDLTRARELLIGIREDFDSYVEQVDTFLANQSAPAAKRGSDE